MWPKETWVIRRCKIFPDETNTGDDDEHMEIDVAKDDGAENNDDDDFGKIPEEEALECLCNADLLQRALNISGPPFKYIVVCEEYKFLRELLEDEFGDYIRRVIQALVRDTTAHFDISSHNSFGA